MSLDKTVSELRDEIAEIRRMLFISSSAILVGMMLWNLSLWNPASLVNFTELEKVFEDMLASRDNLPGMTKLTLTYVRAGDGWLPIAMICSITAVAWSLMSLNRRNPSKFMLIAIIGSLLLCAHRAAISLSLEMPLRQIVQGISEN